MSLIFCPLRFLSRNISGILLSPIASYRTKKLSFDVIASFVRFESTLGRSYVLIQDGIEIRELPWVVKRLSPDEIVENVNKNSTGVSQSVDSDSLFLETQFKIHLKECNSMEEVIKLLEVPGERVSPGSAASALCRIGAIRSAGEHYGSFIRQAVMNELCETVNGNLDKLSCRTVIDLVRSCLRRNNYKEDFERGISAETERRIADCSFTVGDVCDLVTLLSESTSGKFEELLEPCWIHLGSRYTEFNEKNISRVFEVMRYTTSKTKYLITVADKQLTTCWSKLSPSDVTTISRWLTFLDFRSTCAVSLFGRWAYTNVCRLDYEGMRHLLGMYLHFGRSDRNFLIALQKFVRAYARSTAKGANKTGDRTLMHMAASYLREKRILSTVILDSLALDFSLAHDSYGLMEGQSVLKTFGQLGYLPSDPDPFFSAAEEWLSLNHHKMGFEEIFEVLASFTYIERYPINFLEKVFCTRLPVFYSDTLDLATRAKGARYLTEIQSSYLLEFPRRPCIPMVPSYSLHHSFSWMDNRVYRFQKEMSTVLKEVLGDSKFNAMKILRGTSHLINFEVSVNEEKEVVDDSDTDPWNSELAIILVMPSDYNSARRPMGALAMKLRHLDISEYIPIVVHYETFIWRCISNSEKADYIKQLLSEHVNFKS